jgi:hypothetical protein
MAKTKSYVAMARMKSYAALARMKSCVAWTKDTCASPGA